MLHTAVLYHFHMIGVSCIVERLSSAHFAVLYNIK